MRLEKLSATAELVSAIAIVVTLGYLAVQTQQNTEAVQAAVRQSMISDELQILFEQMAYPIVAPGQYSERDLTNDEEVQVLSWLIAFLRLRESHWLQYRAGVIDETTWTTYRAPLAPILSQPLARQYWQAAIGSRQFDAAFVDDVNELLATVPVQVSSSFAEVIGLE